MPSKSPQQHRFMEAAAHNPEFAKKAGVPQNVAKEFVAADYESGEEENRTLQTFCVSYSRPLAIFARPLTGFCIRATHDCQT